MGSLLETLVGALLPLIGKALAQKNEQSRPSPQQDHPAAPVIVQPDKDLISYEDYVTASGKYKERLTHPELTDEVKQNIKEFLPVLNAFLKDLGVQRVQVTSGFRPSSVNAAIPNAAKKSNHMLGKACDIFDPGNTLNRLVLSHPELLKKHALWLEDSGSTPNWCHLDNSTARADRDVRSFKP